MRINAICATGAPTELVLSNAILLYNDRRESKTVFASVHEVDLKKGNHRIKAGVPISKSALKKALTALSPEEHAPVALLDSRILAKGDDYLVWYVKPQKRQIWFKCDELGEASGLTDHPGLVFMVTNKNWHVFAVKGKNRPSPTTPLYVSPYFNVWEDGRICIGNVDTPKGENRFDPEQWLSAFYGSYFTHPNIHTPGGLTKFRGGSFALWRSLLKGTKFQNDWLVPARETLEEAFDRVVKNGRS